MKFFVSAVFTKINFKSAGFWLVCVLTFAVNQSAAQLSTKLQKQIAAVADNTSVGVSIVAFSTSKGLQESHLLIKQNARDSLPASLY